MNRRPFVLALGFALATPALAAEGGGGGSVLITPQIGLIFWTTLTFLVCSPA
jgi:hypothetical protein